MLTVDEIRRKFLEFFRARQFLLVQSSSLVPSDPTLLFTNSGMVQFKSYFSGSAKPPCPRIASVQRCVRAGGKHNDLDNVGYTARHHTFFEMLGNFSFGDYFKREALGWAWEFLTDVLGIPRDRLLVTVYHDDREAQDIWQNDIHLAPGKIIKIATKDNFWEMGETGPCGPCSEIFYDHGEEVAGGPPGSADADGDRYTEIWNIVFTQFSRDGKGELHELPTKNIDTGIGLERLAAVLQGVHSNYEIDLFRKIIDSSRELFGEGDIFAHRIVADHIRSSSFLICDGVLPSNEGRGYVLRRIVRRALLQLYRLGSRDLALHRLVPCLVEVMGEAYPELVERREFIGEVMGSEEGKFALTLEKGMGLLEKRAASASGGILSGPEAFELYDTYGFPLDLTEIILGARGMRVDVEGFEREMEKQKLRARASWTGSGDALEGDLYSGIDEKTDFVGYQRTESEGRIVRLVRDGGLAGEVTEGDRIDLVTDSSCFFGESGGQVGDQGRILLGSPEELSNGEVAGSMAVENTLRTPGGLIVHRGILEKGKFRQGDRVTLEVQGARRARIAANHSATHLLHFALRNLLGSGVVSQRGSQVDADCLRFDFSCDRHLDGDAIRSLEETVNSLIIENSESLLETMDLEKAREMGATALFGEKYGRTVRVVFLAAQNDYLKCNTINGYYSVELCGGTHVRRTGDIGLFKITRVESIAAGVRRIEARTALEALRYVNGKMDMLDGVAGTLRIGPGKVRERVESLLEENKSLKARLSSAEKLRLAAIPLGERVIHGIRVLFGDFTESGASFGDIRQLMASRRGGANAKDTLLSALCPGEGGKFTIILILAENITDRYSAPDLLRKLGSRGGGVPGFATGSLDHRLGLESIVRVLSGEE
ncbi:MAG: alanine--tRNA ligase [Rickettsiales bacterium]|jgi:alanyl-tRNA synthetase|nr:alanine--tRNA ligase [Rickettsiales bacterium]